MFRWRVCAFIALACAALASGQDKVIKHTTVKPTSAASGEEMYANYCAVCHGVDARGSGPAATALKAPPTNLTRLAQKNGGKFPALHVAAILRGESSVGAHGTKEMPVWGPLFWQMSKGSTGEYQQRVSNVTKYLESLQAK